MSIIIDDSASDSSMLDSIFESGSSVGSQYGSSPASPALPAPASLQRTASLPLGPQLKHQLFVPCDRPGSRRRCGWFHQDKEIKSILSESYRPPFYVDVLGVKYQMFFPTSIYDPSPDYFVKYKVVEIDGQEIDDNMLFSEEFNFNDRYRGKMLQIREAFESEPGAFIRLRMPIQFPKAFRIHRQYIKQMHLDSIASKITNYRRFAELDIAQDAANRANPALGDAMSTYVGSFVPDPLDFIRQSTS